MPEAVGGVPIHPLVVHAAVVLVPLSSLLVIVVAVSQERRRQWGVLTWLLTTAALAAVFLARQSGGELREVLFPETVPVRVAQHADYGAVSIWFAVALWLAVSAVLLLDHDRQRRSGLGSPLLPAALSVVAILTAMVASGQILLTAWSGMESYWLGT